MMTLKHGFLKCGPFRPSHIHVHYDDLPLQVVFKKGNPLCQQMFIRLINVFGKYFLSKG